MWPGDLALVFALGACLGSFLDCAAGRAVRGERPWRGRSRCDCCGHVLGTRDLVPLVSWLCLRGRCRFCGAKIGLGRPAAEGLCGAVFCSVAWRFGLTWRTAETLILACVLLYLALVDGATMELPNAPMLLGAASWAAFLGTYPDPLSRLAQGVLGAFALGGGVGLVTLAADRILGRTTLGDGDILLLALLGLYLGPLTGLLLVLAASLIGLGSAALRGAGRGRAFPFAPSIALAAWPVVLFSRPLLVWYLGLFGA